MQLPICSRCSERTGRERSDQDTLEPITAPTIVEILHGASAGSGFEFHLKELHAEFQRLQQENQSLHDIVLESSDLRQHVLSAADAIRLDLEMNDLPEIAEPCSRMLKPEELLDPELVLDKGTSTGVATEAKTTAAEVPETNGSSDYVSPTEAEGSFQTTLSFYGGEEAPEGWSHIGPLPRLPDSEAANVRVSLVQNEATTRSTDDDDEFDGCDWTWQKIVHNGILFTPDVVILLNALTIGMSADIAPGHVVWDVLENLFLAVYTLEFLYKLRSAGCLGFFLGPNRNWNWFDVIVLMVGYVDLAVISILSASGVDLGSLNVIKVVRLVRVVRLLRTLRFKFFDDLKLLLGGIMSGARVLSCAIILLIVLIYALGVIMQSVNNISEKPQKEFSSVPSAMFTLFRCFTDGCVAYDGTPMAERMRTELGGVFFISYILIYMLVVVGVFNLITGIFIDNVFSSQSIRKMKELHESEARIEQDIKEALIHYISGDDAMSVETLAIQNFRKAFHRRVSNPSAAAGKKKHSNAVNDAFDNLCQSGMQITRDQFLTWIHRPEFEQLLDEASIDVAAKGALFDIMDADMGGALSMDEFLTGLMSLRGAVTKNDIIGMALKIRHLTSIIESVQGDDAGGNSQIGQQSTVATPELEEPQECRSGSVRQLVLSCRDSASRRMSRNFTAEAAAKE